jgi:hypothetical protein
MSKRDSDKPVDVVKNIAGTSGGRVVVGKLEFDASLLSEILFIRYMGVAMKQLDDDEDKSLALCCEVFGFKISEGRSIWGRRNKLIMKNEADFIASEDLLRLDIRRLYMKLISCLLDRDFGSESVKSVVEALRVVAQLEAGINVSRGLVPLGKGEAPEPSSGGIQVSRSNVIIVPLPDSARDRVRDIGGQLMGDDAVAGGKSGEYWEEFLEGRKAKMEREARMIDDVELDPIEEARKVANDVVKGRFE